MIDAGHQKKVPQRTVSGRHKWISRYPQEVYFTMSYAYAKAYCILWQPYLWTDVSTAVRLPQICDLVYLVSIVSYYEPESQVSMT